VRRSSTAGGRRRTCTPPDAATLPMPGCACGGSRGRRADGFIASRQQQPAVVLCMGITGAGVEGDVDQGAWVAPLFELRRQRRNGGREARHRLILF
jgi:hypothetical protein